MIPLENQKPFAKTILIVSCTVRGT